MLWSCSTDAFMLLASGWPWDIVCQSVSMYSIPISQHNAHPLHHLHSMLCQSLLNHAGAPIT